jgi:succinate dehydrogenase/fumarate reductase flavoprotein subunit|tara:strand:+ start:13 stop:408 length:396 start_codon:yes stop_codon:yes gene_type:complete
MPSISDKTEIGLPIKNLIGLIGGTAVAVWAYFGIIERLNNIETQGKLMVADVEKNTEFRIKWPRGEMGSLPADAQQDMLIEFISTQLESIVEEMESMMSNTVNIKRSQQDIEKLITDVEKLKDKVRQNGGH